MKETELIKLNQANKFLEMALVFLEGAKKRAVRDVIMSNKDLIAKFGKKELLVLNPTKRELAAVHGGLKKVVRAFYSKNIEKLKVKVERPKHSDRYYDCGCLNPPKYKYCDECQKEVDSFKDIYLEEYDKNKPYRDMFNRLSDLCDLTTIPQEIFSARILIRRQQPDSYNYTHLELETVEFIKTKYLEEFNNQNAEFVKELLSL